MLACGAWALKDSTELFHTPPPQVFHTPPTQHRGPVERFACFQAPDSIRFAHGVTTSRSMVPHACIILNRLAKGSDFPRQEALGKARFHVIVLPCSLHSLPTWGSSWQRPIEKSHRWRHQGSSIQSNRNLGLSASLNHNNDLWRS